jgi:hypothetical protein
MSGQGIEKVWLGQALAAFFGQLFLLHSRLAVLVSGPLVHHFAFYRHLGVLSTTGLACCDTFGAGGFVWVGVCLEGICGLISVKQGPPC